MTRMLDNPKLVIPYVPLDLSSFRTGWLSKSGTRLYKHLPLEHARNLATKGNIRVGTLSQYREWEDQDPTRGDQGEGIYSILVQNYNSDRDGQLSDLLVASRCQPFGSLGATKGQDVSISGINFQYETPDAFVYCMSTSRSHATSRRFRDCDCCVEITQPAAYFRAVSDALGEKHGLRRCLPEFGKVRYVTRQSVAHGRGPKVTLPFLKPEVFSKDQEIRAVWWPDFGARPSIDNRLRRIVEPEDFNIPALANYCRLVDLK